MNDEPQHKHRKHWILCIFAVFIAILGVILPDAEFTPITYINASNISYSGLINVNGSIANISEINNGNWSADESTTPWWININFTNVSHFTFPEFKILYFSTVGASTHVNDIEIFCVTEGNFVDLTTFTNQIEWFYWTRHVPDSMHFIDARGNVTLRINHTSNGNVNHRIRLDTVRLVEMPQFENVNSTINQYFNTTTGSGGVSFNGNPVNLNGSNLFNGTISNYSNQTYVDAELARKYNKSGDNMTGSTRFVRSTSTPNATVGSLSVVDLNIVNPNRVVSFWTTNKVYNESALSYENGTYFNGTAAGLLLDSGSNNTLLNRPPSIGYFSFEPQNAGVNYTFWFQSNPVNTTVLKGNITITNLSGTGNAVTQVDSSGLLLSNRTAGAGIPMTSPDGTVRCLRVSNTGVLTANAGAC